MLCLEFSFSYHWSKKQDSWNLFLGSYLQYFHLDDGQTQMVLDSRYFQFTLKLFFFADVPESTKLPPARVSLRYFQFKIFSTHHSPHISLPIQIPLQHAQSLVKVFCHFLCRLAATRAWCVWCQCSCEPNLAFAICLICRPKGIIGKDQKTLNIVLISSGSQTLCPPSFCSPEGVRNLHFMASLVIQGIIICF